MSSVAAEAGVTDGAFHMSQFGGEQRMTGMADGLQAGNAVT